MNPYNKRIYNDRMHTAVSRAESRPTSDDEFVFGVVPLSDQIRSMRAGGLPLSSRTLSDSNYDEDDVTDVDPSSQFGLDRFERVTAITDRISDRAAKKKKKQLETANV